MRILLAVPTLDPRSGGMASAIPKLAAAFVNVGEEVGLLIAQDEASEPELDPKVPVVQWDDKWGIKTVGRQKSAEPFEGIFENGLPSVVHDNGIWLPFHHRVAAATKNAGIPRVVSPHGMLRPWALKLKSGKKNIAWWAYQRRDVNAAKVIHATALEEAENLCQLGVSQPIAVVPNGVDLPDEREVVAERTLRRSERRALFLSRIHPKKGLLILIQAWQAVQPQDWELIIAGPDEGGHQRVVQKAVEQAGLSNQVHFHGPAYGSEKEELYRQADLFILPTFGENFGVAVAEALSWGVPVITTKGAPWQELEDSSCGWWVDIGKGPLVEAMRQAMSICDEDRRRMGMRGRAFVERELTWPRVATELLAVYRWILCEGPRPQCVL